MLHVLEELELSKIAKKYKLNSILLFGSILTSDFNEESDIDIAVLGDLPLDLDEVFELEMYFEDQYKRAIDVVDLRSESLDFFIKVNILNTAKVIYTCDHEKMLDDIKEQAQWYYKENETFFF